MGEIERWFEDTLGHLGFSLTPTMYNPETFTPIKGILYTYTYWIGEDGEQRRCVKLRTTVTPDLAQDLSGGFVPFNPIQEYKDLLIQTIRDELDRMGLPIPNFGTSKPIDFTPKKKITKLKFK